MILRGAGKNNRTSDSLSYGSAVIMFNYSSKKKPRELNWYFKKINKKNSRLKHKDLT